MATTLKSSIKKIVYKLKGTYAHLKIGVKCNHQWYGNKYGGFYLCPELLNPNSIVYSFGIGQDISFDKEVQANHNCDIHCFDPTPKSIHWLKSQTLNKKFHVYEYGISVSSGYVDFYLPKNPDHVSGSSITQKNIDIQNKVSVEMKSLKDIMVQLGHQHIDVLKMDIEGAEYEVINDVLNAKISINQILIEFHDRLFENGHLKSKQIVELFKRNNFEIFAVSQSFEEVSFINKNAL